MAAATPGVSKAPATIPRWPIEMLEPSMKSAKVDTKEVVEGMKGVYGSERRLQGLVDDLNARRYRKAINTIE